MTVLESEPGESWRIFELSDEEAEQELDDVWTLGLEAPRKEHE
jgi:hypothetical protein